MTSVDVGVSEPGLTGGPMGTSIGRIGTGSQPSDFTWALISDDTPGGVNNGQTFVAAGGTPALSINDVSIAEGDAGTVTLTFTVSLTTAAGVGGVTFDIATADGTATTADNDYVGRTLTSQTIPEGSTSYTFDVTVNADDVPESNETFFVNVANVTGATVSDGQGQGSITNDDAFGSLAINDVTLAEGNSGTTDFTFTVTRSGGDDGTVSADYTVNLPGGAGGADGSDVSGTLGGTVTFLDGETSKTITVTVNGDMAEEPNENFTVTLSNPQGGVTISDDTGAGTITNDDSPPVVSIGDSSVVEGADGVSYLVFTLTLDHSSTSTVTVDFATADGSATAGSDYVGHSGQVSFAPGETSQTVSIPIIGDTDIEANETFTVTLTNPVNGSVGDDSATGTITNDDGSAYYSLASGSFTQDWTNTGLITTSDNWSGVPFIIGFRGDDLTTAVGADARTILTTSNVIDVNANQTNPNTNTSGGVTEFDGIADPVVGLQGSGTADAPYLALYMDASGRSDIRVQANLRDIDGSTDDSGQQIAVQYRTSPNGPWLNAPGGYFSDVTTGGAATQVTAVDITLPSDVNGAATLEIRFLTTNASGNDEWVGIDDIVVSSQQSGPILSIANTAVFEGDAGTTPITFTVTRDGNSAGAVTADYTVNFPGGADGATSNDFAAGQTFTGQVSFADGETSATITLNVAGDVGPELDDHFTVSLSNVVGGTIGDGVATGTIVNDDGQPPLVTVNDVTVTEGDSGTSLMTFTVTRTGGTGAFDVNYETQDGSATAGSDYDATSGTLHFADGQLSQTVSVTINGDTDSELSETLNLVLSDPTDFALLTDATGVGTIAGDDPIYIHDIQGTSYFSPLLAAEGIHAFNVASAGLVTVRAIVTAVDDDGPRQGYYLSEEVTDWDGNSYTSEGIFVMTRDDASVGNVVSGVTVGDLVQVSANVMEYQTFDNMPRTVLVNPTGLSVISHSNELPVLILTNIPNEVLTGVTPDYFDSSDDANDSFDASTYALSYFETVEGMLVTVPNMVVADGFVQGGQASPFFQAYSLDSANPDQINSRGGYTVAGDPPVGPPDTPGTGDDTHTGGRVAHDGDMNPDIIQVEYGGFGMDAPAGLHDNASMGDQLGDLTGIIDFDFTDRVLYVTDMDTGAIVDTQTTQDTTVFGDDSRALTMAAFNVNNLDPGDGAARFAAIADAIAHNLNAPDIVSIEEIQDNNGETNDGNVDASTTWQMLVDALNAAVPGAHYQWVDQNPVNGTEGGAPGGNIRVGFLYNTDRVQLGDLDANATIDERREFTDRIGDGVRDAGDRIAFDDSMIASEIQTSDWSSTRRSLLGEFTFHGNTVYVTANHFTSKLGSGEFWQFDQDLAAGDPVNEGIDKRSQQAEDVYTMLNVIQQANPDAGIISGGDYNEFYFNRPLTTLTGYTNADGTARVGGARFDNLTLSLPEAERYTYTFDGRSQAIDHIIVNDLLNGVASYDVTHLNTGFNPNNTLAISDHDPGVANFDFRSLDELLIGTVAGDAIDGFGGGDHLFGLAGNDLLIGGAGTDVLEGGGDDDTYFIDSAADQVVESVGAGSDAIYTQVSYALGAGQEVEVLSLFDRTAVTTLGLMGNAFAQTLIGDAGANYLNGGAGVDTFYGLGGNDTYLLDNASETVIEGVGGGTDAVYTMTSYVLTAGQEVEVMALFDRPAASTMGLTGNAFAQTLIGDAGDNLFNGGGGTDVFYGLGGNDTYFIDSADDFVAESVGGGSDAVYAMASHALAIGQEVEVLSAFDQGGTGALNLTGNSFAQTIIGNAGDNVLDGGAGGDVLYGLGGNDTFAFTTALGAGNVDLVVGFTTGADRIALDDAIFTHIGGLGALNASAFVTGTQAADASDRIIYDSATGQLLYDADGAGGVAAVQFATLNGAPALAISDFIVI
jgi:predicted extracellular nuclease